MKTIKTLTFVLFLLIISLQTTYGLQEMKLLAVSESRDGEMIGSTADLSLEVKRGSGRVFMETYPFTKLDTQMSTHFAKEIACNYVGKDCSNYDFFYTIRSNSAIIGGPSAGAAITFITIAELEGDNIPDDFSITGTMNLGGIVGRVGGIKQKIDAAARADIDRVFIPKGERFYSEDTAMKINVSEEGEITDIYGNESKNTSQKTDLVEHGKTKGVEVVEVSTIDQLVCRILENKEDCEKKLVRIDANENYESTMLNIGVELCNRTNKLIEMTESEELKEALKNNVINHSIDMDIDIASLVDLMIKRRMAFQAERYYSMASFCFSSNLILQRYLTQEKSIEQIREATDKINRSKEYFKKQINKKKINSITDLQTYIIVKERLYETSDYLDFTHENLISLKNNDSDRQAIINASQNSLAYATERFYSASMWADFFGADNKEMDINQETLKKSCQDKIYEAQERVEYMKLYFPYLTEDAQKAIDIAAEEHEKKDYAYCLFKASKAKSQIDTMIGSFSVNEDNIDELLEDKKRVSASLIKTQQDKGNFPILGYSYYQYGQSLGQSEEMADKTSALLYYDYAIEFSNMDLYFDEKKDTRFYTEVLGILQRNTDTIIQTFMYSAVFVIGIIIGMLSSQVMLIDKKRTKKRPAKKKNNIKRKKKSTKKNK